MNRVGVTYSKAVAFSLRNPAALGSNHASGIFSDVAMLIYSKDSAEKVD